MWSTMWQAELSPTQSNRTRWAAVWIAWPRQGFPRSDLSSWEWGKEGIQLFLLLSVFCHQDIYLIQQWLHIFHQLLFAADALVETFPVVLDIPCQTQFQVGFGLPHHIPAYTDNVPVILPVTSLTKITLGTSFGEKQHSTLLRTGVEG